MIEAAINNKEFRYLQFVEFKDLGFWDAKRYANNSLLSENHGLAKMAELLQKQRSKLQIQNDQLYKQLTIRLYGNGATLRKEEFGRNIKTKNQYVARSGQLVFSRIDARSGAFGIVPTDLDGAIVSNDFPVYSIKSDVVSPSYLQLVISSLSFTEICKSKSSGTTGRRRMSENDFESIKIPLPPLSTQQELITAYNQKLLDAGTKEQKANQLEKSIDEYLIEELGIELPKAEARQDGFLKFVEFKNLKEWGSNKISIGLLFSSRKYDLVSLDKKHELFVDLFRGKSPKYDESSDKIILNQKCVRWNDLKLEFGKSVNQKWLNGIEKNALTKLGDVIINSTGEGTIGRSTQINKAEWEGHLCDSHVLLLRLDKHHVNPSFFTEFFNSKFGQWQVDEIKSAQSTKQTELGLTNLKKIKFPLPPLEIQNKIATKITSIKEEIKTLKQESQNLKTQAKEEFEKEVFV